MTELGFVESFNGLARLPLAETPTPLVELKKLSALMYGPRIFMKREDLIGFAMGGNKVRKFEFFMADALQNDKDCCIAIGAIQPNHARVAAASALHCGLDAYLLLMGERPPVEKGNLTLDYMLGAKITYIPPIFDFEERLNAMQKLADSLEQRGRNPYVLPVVSPMGCLGPLMAMQETLKQAEMMNIHFDHQFIPVGSGESVGGLVMGAVLESPELETVGVCIGRDKELMKLIFEDLCVQFADVIGLRGGEKTLHYSLEDRYLGKGGHPTEEGLNAIRLVAKTEGIFLDPIYTGKAMAAMLDMINKNKFKKGENLLFWNSSSSPVFFAYEDQLELDKA